jgi:hypothetical protein
VSSVSSLSSSSSSSSSSSWEIEPGWETRTHERKGERRDNDSKMERNHTARDREGEMMAHSSPTSPYAPRGSPVRSSHVRAIGVQVSSCKGGRWGCAPYASSRTYTYDPGPSPHATHCGPGWDMTRRRASPLTYVLSPPHALLLAGPYVCPRGGLLLLLLTSHYTLKRSSPRRAPCMPERLVGKLPSQLALSMTDTYFRSQNSRGGRSTPLVLILCQDHVIAVSFPSSILAGAPW